MSRILSLYSLLCALCLFPGDSTASEDVRKAATVTLQDYHPFREYGSAADWPSRKQAIRERVQLAAGLLPFPEKTPLNESRSGRQERDGFAVEKVYFESFPGHFVTATLYSPAGESLAMGLRDGKRPAVLCPHGHWKNGRFYDLQELSGETAVKQQIAMGAERFVSAARNPIQARCIQLARMGCYVLQYDMLGNADSKQLEEHRRGPRESMNSSEKGKWGFVSPMATLRLQTNFGLQTWNSVRALDFLFTLEDVDADRILVTGASGGATQTMMITAIDERVSASFPCVMASTAMQGGCTCENSHYLRIGQGNMDIAAAAAPHPLGLTAADDWTVELETKGHPDLLALYKDLNAPGNYEAHFDIHFKHNYNHVSRTHMYGFVNRHFKLGQENPVLERDFEFMDSSVLTVWPEGEAKPANYVAGDDHERAVNQAWADLSDAALTKENARKGWELILRRHFADVGEASFELENKTEADGFLDMTGSILHEGEVVEARFLYPQDWKGEVVLWLTRNGYDGLENNESVRQLVSDGKAVMGLHLFGQKGDGKDLQNASVTYSGKKDVPENSWQRSPVYFYGYNDSLFVRRVHDILSAIKMAKTHPKWEVSKIAIDGDPGTGHWAAAAALMAEGDIDKVNTAWGDFRFSSLTDVWDEDFVPGAVNYGDIEMLGSLVEP